LHRVADPAVIEGRVPVVVALAEVTPADVVRRQRVADRHVVALLRRDCERPGGARPVGVVAGVVIVEYVVTPWLAVLECLVRKRRQEGVDRADAWLLAVRALGVRAARVTVLAVVVVGAGLRVRVLDLVRRWLCRPASSVLEGRREAGAERDVVSAGTALHCLVVVVA